MNHSMPIAVTGIGIGLQRDIQDPAGIGAQLIGLVEAAPEQSQAVQGHRDQHVGEGDPAFSVPARGSEVVIHEIHYQPPEGEIFEFVELHNTHPLSVDISGFFFADGIDFVFPEATRIAPLTGRTTVNIRNIQPIGDRLKACRLLKIPLRVRPIPLQIANSVSLARPLAS